MENYKSGWLLKRLMIAFRNGLKMEIQQQKFAFTNSTSELLSILN